MNSKKQVFISWSKEHSGDIAHIFKKWLDKIFNGKRGFNAQINFFISQEIGVGKNWREEILGALFASDMGVFILTPQNKDAPWIIFEAGCLHEEQNSKRICPIVFGREKGQIERPLEHLMATYFENKESFLTILKSICFICDIDFEKNIKRKASGYWEKINDELAPLIDKAKKWHPSDNKRTTKQQKWIFTPAEKIFPVKQLTINQIPHFFGEYAKSRFPAQYCKKTQYEDGEWATNFLIKNTRISNFVVFTDGIDILILDRTKNGKIEVKNNKYHDVFGAVTFENKSIITKLNNYTDFLESIILKIEEIPGFAFEENEDEKNKEDYCEAVVMFGYAVYVSTEDLNKIPRNAEDVFFINIDDPQQNLTAKAGLAQHFLQYKKENNKNI